MSIVSNEEDYRNFLSDSSEEKPLNSSGEEQALSDSNNDHNGAEDRFVQVDPKPNLEYVQSNKGRADLFYKD